MSRVALAPNDLFSLPKPLLTALDAADRLRNDRAALEAPANPFYETVNAVVTAAGKGKTAPDPGGPLLMHDAAMKDYQASSRVLQAAVEVAEANVNDLYHDLADEIRTKHLQPVLDQIIEKGREAIVLLPEGITDTSLLAAGETVRSARLDLDQLAYDYFRIRQAYNALPLPRPQRDEHGDYHEMRNTHDLWPELALVAHRNALGFPPWPTSTTERFRWLLRRGADFWMPSAAEQDAHWSRCRPVQAERFDELEVRRRDVAEERARREQPPSRRPRLVDSAASEPVPVPS